MKKIFVLLAAIGMSFNVMAGDDSATALTQGGSSLLTPDGTTAGTGTVVGECALLSEAVTINLSPDVLGAYACNITDNIIGVATCHPTGRKGDVTVDCSTDANEDGYNADCVASGTGTAGTMVVNGGLAFAASSRGGKVTGVGSENCVVTGGSTTAEAATAAGL